MTVTFEDTLSRYQLMDIHTESSKSSNLKIVSVLSIFEQKLLLLRHKQACFKISEERRQQYNNVTNSPLSCPVTWDDLLCWDNSQAGTVAKLPCPSYINGFNRNAYVTKFCTENGTWWVSPITNHTWSNYSECVRSSIDFNFHAAHGDKLRLLYTIGYSFSFCFLLVAIIIMMCCKRLHSKSSTLHINLFLAFIFRAAISFLKDILFVKNVGLAKDVRRDEDGNLEFIQDASHWECKLLMSIFMYCVMACNMWILSEALYLTMLVSRPLVTEREGVRVYIVLGWSLSLVVIIPWVIVKALYEDTFCWNIQSNPDYYWILRGSGVGVVVINFFLFLNICRKLFLKLRHSSHMGTNSIAKYRKLAKFILVLIPLFGIMYIAFYVAVPSNFEETEFNVTYLYLEMGYNSFQGFILALLFCFLNEEVHGELKRIWRRHRKHRNNMSMIRSSNFHSSTRRKHSTQTRGSLDCHMMTTFEHSNNIHKKLYRPRTSSNSYESGSDMFRNTNSSIDRIKKWWRISSTEKDTKMQAVCSVNHVALSLFTNIDQSDSMLQRHVNGTNTQCNTQGLNTTDSDISLPLPQSADD